MQRRPVHAECERRNFAAGYHHRQDRNLIFTPDPHHGFEMHGAAGFTQQDRDDQRDLVGAQLSVAVISRNRQLLLGQQRYAGGYQSNVQRRQQYRPDASRAVGIFQL